MAKQSELGPSRYCSILNPDDLSWIRIWYEIPPTFDIELPKVDDRVDNLPPSRLAVYEKAIQTGLRFLVHLFIFDLFHFYGLSFCTIAPNSFSFAVGFLVLCFMASIQPSVDLFRSFFTIKRHPHSKD